MFFARLRQSPVRRLSVFFPLFVTLALILFSAPGSYSVPSQVNSPNAMLSITANDNGRTLNLHTGDYIQIELFENASTGYRWEIDQLNPGMIDKISEKAHYHNTAIGSGGTMEFVFQAKAKGNTVIALKYLRPWEGDSSIVQRFRLDLNIQS